MATDPTGRISHIADMHRGLTWKPACRVATTANITIATALNNGDTLDGVTLATGDRVLVKNQSTASQNGIYIVGATPTRAADMDQDTTTTTVPAEEIAGAVVFVISGTTNASTIWYTTNAVGGTVGSTSITWTEFTGGGTGTDLGWYNVEDYGAVHNGSTDDTAAIQAAIDACATAGGGTVYFPCGTYQIDGALRDTGTYNSQLEIPANSGSWLAIRLLGGCAPTPTNYVKGGTILRSSWNGTISGNPSILSAGTYDTTSPNYVVVTFENIIIEAHEDPKLTAIDMTGALAVRCIDLTINVSRSTPFTLPAPWAVPTHSNAVGLDMPYGSNSQPMDGGTALYVEGFYTGLRPSEQASFDLVKTAFCTRGVEMRGTVNSSPYWRHLAHITHLATFWCPRGIVFSTDQRWLNILAWDIEHDSTPFTAVYDIDDASNYGRGFIGWHTTDISTGPEDNLLVNGATGLSLFGAYAKRWKLNNVIEIPTGTDPSTNAATGGRLYAASATGHPSWRDSAGTVTDLLSTSPSFATPAIVLGTAAAAGAASTVIRSDSTIVAFDATVPVTQAFSDAAATGSSAHAARRDHVHGMPATPSSGSGASDHEHIQNVVFSGDGATTVWELPAAPVDATGVVVYVTGSRSQDWTLSGTLLTTLTFGSAPASAANNIVIDIEAAVA